MVISDFHRDVDEICAILENWSVHGGCSLPTFRHNISIPSSGVKNPYTAPINLPEPSVEHYHYTLRSFPKDRESQSERETSKDELQKVGESVC